MRRIVIDRAGGRDRLQLVEAPDPRPGPGEVLVVTDAIGVNYADVAVRMGLYASAKKYVGWPITPGFEFSGQVAAVGEHVDDLLPGQQVMGLTRFFGYASHIVVPRAQLFARPVGFSAEQTAGFPVIFLTAYYALFECVNARPGAALLVHSAAGGVGGALVQLGKIAGCRVVGVVGGPHKVDAAREAGADVVIDKSSEPLWPRAAAAAPAGYDAVFDANGVETLAASYRHLAPMGRLVIYGFHTMLPRNSASGRPNWLKLARDYLRTPRFSPLALTNDNKSVMAFNLSYLFDKHALLREAMERLLGWVAEQQLRAPPVTTHPLERAADAHRELETARTVGKLVLLP